MIVTDREHDIGVLSGFRHEFYRCLPARADVLFELTDAMLCTERPVKTLVDLTLTPEHRRGHGAMYDGLNHGQVDIGRLRRTLAGLPLPRFADRRIVLAVDVSPWLRSDAACSAQRIATQRPRTELDRRVTPRSKSRRRSDRQKTRRPLYPNVDEICI